MKVGLFYGKYWVGGSGDGVGNWAKRVKACANTERTLHPRILLLTSSR